MYTHTHRHTVWLMDAVWVGVEISRCFLLSTFCSALNAKSNGQWRAPLFCLCVHVYVCVCVHVSACVWDRERETPWFLNLCCISHSLHILTGFFLLDHTSLQRHTLNNCIYVLCQKGFARPTVWQLAQCKICFPTSSTKSWTTSELALEGSW